MNFALVKNVVDVGDRSVHPNGTRRRGDRMSKTETGIDWIPLQLDPKVLNLSIYSNFVFSKFDLIFDHCHEFTGG